MYADRFPEFRAAGFYRQVREWTVSSLGIGTYLGPMDEAGDRAYTDALIAAGENGINFFDCAINYRHQRSERNIGAALKRLNRDELVICTKAGFLTPGAMPPDGPGESVGGIHAMGPDFLAHQIECSRGNLGVDTIDVFYVHNPETQLGFVSHEEFDKRIRAAFGRLEKLVANGKIRYYGVATWDGFTRKDGLSLTSLAEIAAGVGGPDHHFRFLQLPFNLAMVSAFVNQTDNVLEAAARLGITAVASASLMHGKAIRNMPDAVAKALPGLETDAQRAIQFTRSTPGISVALVGMSRSPHVLENLGVARVPPLPRERYLKLYQ
jgi:aryl-alcohol dehydrogenase-like predicted oxidoreductase